MILVTGVSGFIGKHLLRSLIKDRGAENIIALTSKPITECRYILHNNYNFEKDHFTKFDLPNITTLIHVGAYTPKSGLEANHINGCNSNIASCNMLLNADLPHLEKIIYLSTLDVYREADIISEHTKTEPSTLYGASKLYCEKMLATWCHTKNIVFHLLRIGHVYGPGEEAYQKIIPSTFTKILDHKPIQIWGEGNELRSFIFIEDVIAAIERSLTYDENISPINIVSDQSISINELVKKMILISGSNNKVEHIPSNLTSKNFVFDTRKLNKFLLSKETSLESGLKKEFEYMQQLIK